MAEYKVNAGDLRTRITFQEPTLTADAGGAQVAGYATIAETPTVWARWINDHGAEAVQGEALRSTQRATVTIRHRSDVQTTWRILKGTDVWQILSLDPVQDRSRYIEMRVEHVKGSI